MIDLVLIMLTDMVKGHKVALSIRQLYRGLASWRDVLAEERAKAITCFIEFGVEAVGVENTFAALFLFNLTVCSYKV